MMSENKTKPTVISPSEYIASLESESRRNDSKELLKIMQDVTHDKPVMWGPSMIGFGTYHYAYASGREGDAFKVGFSPRKAAIVLYGFIMHEQTPEHNKLLAQLGPHTHSKACVYIKSLKDIDKDVLRQLIVTAYAQGDYTATV
ncbi:MAG: DUF1801 domain-containing protein [Candidatus Saccharimonas sp.]